MSDILDKKKLNILIIGTGMYVCGRGADGYGTILPAIYEWKKSGLAGDVYIAGTRPDSIRAVREKAAALDKLYGFTVNINYYPKNETNDPEAYKKAINDIPKPACAIVVVPDDLHRTVAGYAVENGLHTLVVKPLAPTIKDTLELIAPDSRFELFEQFLDEGHPLYLRWGRYVLDLVGDVDIVATGNPYVKRDFYQEGKHILFFNRDEKRLSGKIIRNAIESNSCSWRALVSDKSIKIIEDSEYYRRMQNNGRG